jgi:ribosomal protein L30E
MIISINNNRKYNSIKYKNEYELQKYINDYPSLLDPISKINKQEYPIFIISKEFNVKSGYIDLFAIDIEGNLYIIETKLAENPEIRRSVIGQVLEYANNLTEMNYDSICNECNKYFQKNTDLNKIINNYYKEYIKNNDIEMGKMDYKKVISENIKNGKINIVIIANNISYEIQKLINYIDEITNDKINFIVLEINKYEIDNQIYLYSNIVWAAKYIKSLFSRSIMKENEYLESLEEELRHIIIIIDKKCNEIGLNKVSTTKGISWKSENGGSIYVSRNILSTNWSTIKNDSNKFNKYKININNEAKRNGFILLNSKYGGFKIVLNKDIIENKIDRFIELAISVIKYKEEDNIRMQPSA